MVANTSPEDASDARTFHHDVANHLNAIAMTLEALSAVRADAQQFEELLQLMRENVGSLKLAFSELTDKKTAPSE